MSIARGEYVYSMDADDALVDTALAELYENAERFDADVVHCDKNFAAPGETVTTDRNFLKEVGTDNGALAGEPIFESEDLAVRVKKFAEGRFAWAPWSHLIRREFLLNSGIKLENLSRFSISDDFMFSFFVLCRAAKIVLMPGAIYVYRNLKDSLSRGRIGAVDKFIHQRVGDFFNGMKLFDDFMNEFELFRAQPYYKYIVFDLFAANCALEAVARVAYSQIPAFQLDAFIRAEFDKVENNSAAVAFLFSRMSMLTLNLVRQHQQIQQQQQQIQQLQAQLQQAQLPQFQLQSEDVFK